MEAMWPVAVRIRVFFTIDRACRRRTKAAPATEEVKLAQGGNEAVVGTRGRKGAAHVGLVEPRPRGVRQVELVQVV